MRRSSASDVARLRQHQALDESSVASTSYLAPSSTSTSMLVVDRASSSHLQSASRKANGKGKARAQDDDEEEAELAQGLAGSLLHGQAPGSQIAQAASWELVSGASASSSAYSVRSPPPAAAMASKTASAAARRRRRRRSAETGSPASRAGMTTTAATATTLLLLPCLAGLAAAASVALGSGAGGLAQGYRLGQAERAGGAAVQGLGRLPAAPSQAQQRPAPALYQDERLLSFSSSSSSPQAPEPLRLLPRQSGKGAADASSSSSSSSTSSAADGSSGASPQRDPNAGFNTPGSIGRAGTVVDLVICLLSTIGSVTIIVPFLRNKRGRKLRHALIFGLGLSDLGSS